MIVRVTLHLASPILLTPGVPATPDTWLAWAAWLRTGRPYRIPEDPDWLPDVPLPLARDPVADVWAVSSCVWPDPGVVAPNTGSRTFWTPADWPGAPAVWLYTPKNAAASGPYRAMRYDLTGWSTPRVQFWADTPDPAAFARVLAVLAATGVGAHTRTGYGAVRAVAVDPDPACPSAVWDPDGRPRRPVPWACRPAWPADTPGGPYALAGPRWRGAATVCAFPPLATWRPRVLRAASSLEVS